MAYISFVEESDWLEEIRFVLTFPELEINGEPGGREIWDKVRKHSNVTLICLTLFNVRSRFAEFKQMGEEGVIRRADHGA